MSIQLQIEEPPGYLAAKFTGFGATEEIWRQFAFVAERCKRANKNKLLIDIAEALCGASIADRFFLGDESQVFMYYKLTKVAFVIKSEQLDPRRFGETVARNRWVNTQVFTNVEDAKLWLLK